MSDPAPGRESAERPGTLVSVGGLLAAAGALLVVASLVVDSVRLGETVIDLYLVGGVVFAVGFAAGAQLHLGRGDTRRAAAQVVAAVGWLLVVVGGSTGPRLALWVGVVVLAAAAVVLYDVPDRLRRRLG